MINSATLNAPAQTKWKNTTLSVPGVRCAGCIAKIESSLGVREGVKIARVNLSSKRVAIFHDERVSEAGLISMLEQLGFPARSADDDPWGQDGAEAKALQKALAVAGFGMMNVLLLSVSIWAGAQGAIRDLFHWISAVIALPVIAYAGRPFFNSAIQALRHGRTNMDVPISVGILLATGLSVFETVHRNENVYFDGAIMLLFFLLVGRTLDLFMRKRTRSGVQSLLAGMKKSASVVGSDGAIQRVSWDRLSPGLLIAVAAGEAVAADGIVEQGASAIDNSMLTGESDPVSIATGDRIYAGAINFLDPIRVRVTEVGSATVISEIARLMEDAGQHRSRYVRIADRAARLYSPVVHLFALSALLGWLFLGADIHQALVIAISVLIITCPCAMGLAVPAAHVVASGALMRRGLLIKDGSALERLAEVDVAIFDKTGTLTRGKPRPNLSKLDDQFKAIALALAQSSRHPLSISLSKALSELIVSPARISSVRELSGIGVTAFLSGRRVSIGRPVKREKHTAVEVTVGGKARTVIFKDALRSDVGKTLKTLSQMGLPSSILSGDAKDAVCSLGQQLGIRAVGEIRPADKLKYLERLKRDGRRPLMIGDGLNDGPALAAAHASIAPGTASDASKLTSDAVFLGEDLMPVAIAVHVARRTQRIVRQNFGFAVLYNAIAIPAALAGYVTPLIAAIAMSGSSLVVVGNSLRLAIDRNAK